MNYLLRLSDSARLFKILEGLNQEKSLRKVVFGMCLDWETVYLKKSFLGGRTPLEYPICEKMKGFN